MKQSLFAFALLLAACGGDSTTHAPASDAPAVEAPADEAPADEAPAADAEAPASAEAPAADAAASAEAPAAGAAAPDDDEDELSKVAASIKPLTDGPALAPDANRKLLLMETSKSSVEWTSVKNGTAEVKGRFTALGGGLSIDPKDLRTMTGEVGIDLLGIDSGDKARDTNISSIFFNSLPKTPVHGQVAVTGVRPEKLSIEVGESTRALAQAGINFGADVYGVMIPIEIKRTHEARWEFTTLEPLEVTIPSLGLSERKAALIKACGHESLADVVKATGTIVFGQG